LAGWDFLPQLARQGTHWVTMTSFIYDIKAKIPKVLGFSRREEWRGSAPDVG